MTPEADLRLASLQDCAVMEVRKDGTISHISPSWELFTPLKVADCINRPVRDFVDGTDADKQVFDNAIAQMHNQSFKIVFSTVGRLLEAQGILVEGSMPVYSLWIVRPYQGDLSGDLSSGLKEAVGSGSEVLSLFLADLKAAVFESRSSYPAPRYELCRICDTYVPNWWFARHTEFCTIGHTLESRIVQSHDALVEHRAVLGQLQAAKHREYKGVPIKVRSNLHAVRVSSPLASTRRHSVGSDFASTVQALLQTVDQALEIDMPEDESESSEEEATTPRCDAAAATPRPITRGTRAKIASLHQWSPPESRDPGLAALIADTQALVLQKLNYVLRMRNFFALSRRAHDEVEQQVAEQVALITTGHQVDMGTGAGAGAGAAANTSEVGLGIEDDTDDDREPRRFRRGSSRSSVHPFESPQPKLVAAGSGSPTISPWQSPIPSPRLGPIHHRTMSRTMLPSRDRSTSIASDDSSVGSSGRFKIKPPSINDYEVVSPISRGAFATVYLTRKKNTGEYFAMKCLKKSEVYEKNQVLSVKSERSILMSTAESPYVAKLYYTFQTRDYLYFVMEYASGGDCASLLRALVCLTEEWAKRYIAETIVAVQSLHAQGIVHCDIKPDNLLIDAKGHLKLSDFGLSTKSLKKKQLQTANKAQNFFGTPDYCAPETINLEKQSEATDWWALGCVLYEFLYGAPPFNADTPQEIFERILQRQICWPELAPELDASPHAKDLIGQLLRLDPAERLSYAEIVAHPFFEGLDWDTLFEQEPSFIPEISRPDQTDYFDDRGASMSSFEEIPIQVDEAPSTPTTLNRAPSTASMSSTVSSRRASRLDSDGEFGPFSYKNVSMLERQNLELITKLKTEADMRPRRLSMSSPISSGATSSAYWESAVHDSSPFASDTEESASKHAALNRVHRRRLQRKSSSGGGTPEALSLANAPSLPAPAPPDVLICISNPIWLYSTEKLLRDLGCRVVSCSTGDEAIRRGSSTVQFDLILIDYHLSSGLQPQDIAHILQVTTNANSDTPVVLVAPAGEATQGPFIESIDAPVDRAKLLAVLQKYCRWAPR